MRPAIFNLTAGLATLIIVTAPVTSRAQPATVAPDFVHAAEIYRQASSDLAEARYDNAARGFTAAYEITKDAMLFFKIGIANEKAGKCDVALSSYDRYLKEAKPSQKFVDMTNERIKACGRGAGATTPDFAQAAEIYRTAGSAMTEGHYDDAARGFGAAYEITKDAMLFFKIGIANEKAGKCDVALTSYDRYLKEAKPSQKFVDMTNERIKACSTSSPTTALAAVHVAAPSPTSAPVTIGGLSRRSREVDVASVRAGKGPDIGRNGIEEAAGPKLEFTAQHRIPESALLRDPAGRRGPPVRPDRHNPLQ